VTDTARALLVAALLAGAGLGLFVRRLAQIDPAEPERLIGELRFAHWMGVVLTAVGGAWIGLAAARSAHSLAGVDLTLALAAIILGAWTFQQETRRALVILCVAFFAHAIIDIAHRPGGLAADLAPRWFTLGCAAFNLYLSALCFWAQRRPGHHRNGIPR
jgi:hypothetical protein